MELTPQATTLVIIVCSILGGLLLILLPVGLLVLIRNRSAARLQKRNTLQLNEEEFKKNIEYATHGINCNAPKKEVYMDFNDEDMMDGMPKKFEHHPGLD